LIDYNIDVFKSTLEQLFVKDQAQQQQSPPHTLTANGEQGAGLGLGT
jgi:hypothetical protein